LNLDTNKRRRGRPPKEPPFLKEVADLVGRGVPLRKALWKVGVFNFTERELKNIYRLKKFREYYETAKIEFFREFLRLPRRSRIRPIEKLLAKMNIDPLQKILREIDPANASIFGGIE
jgi:hypothetical protein